MNPRPEPARIPGLDFAKGALVFIMVLYHWMNYYLTADEFTFRYLRFLTPSFIFITGFLIAQVYLPRFTGGSRIPARLATRGAKLLALVVALNLIPGLTWGFFTGNGPGAFSVLAPISYLLIASAGLLFVWAQFRPVFHLLSAALVLSAWWCERTGVPSGYLEVFSMGVLGVSAGHLPRAVWTRALRNPLGIAVAYAAYAAAVAAWNAVYLLQVIGVGVNLAALYWIGEALQNTSAGRLTMRLGGYSLFAYIAQIVILQVLRRGPQPLGTGLDAALMALAAGATATVLSVELLDWMKQRSGAVNRLYGAVFA